MATYGGDTMIELHIRVTLNMNGLARRTFWRKRIAPFFMKWKQKIYKEVLSNNDYNKLIKLRALSGTVDLLAAGLLFH